MIKITRTLSLLVITGFMLLACSSSNDSSPQAPQKMDREYDSKASVMVYNLVSDVSQTNVTGFPHIKLETDPSQSDPSVWFESLGPLSSTHTGITWMGTSAESIVYKIYDASSVSTTPIHSESITTQPNTAYALFVYGDLNGSIDIALVPILDDPHVADDIVLVQAFHAASAYSNNIDLYAATDETNPIANNLAYGALGSTIEIPENMGKDYVLGATSPATPDFVDTFNNDITSLLPLSMHGGERHFVVTYSNPAGSSHVAGVIDYLFPL